MLSRQMHLQLHRNLLLPDILSELGEVLNCAVIRFDSEFAFDSRKKSSFYPEFTPQNTADTF